MVIKSAVLSAALFLFTLLLASTSSDVEFVSNRRRENEELFCPDSEETLFYNIDIFIEGIGDECEIEDLMDIGRILQKVVDEVEEEIPDREDNESMETFVCVRPLEEEIERRQLHANSNHTSRFLRESINSRRRKRYRYAGSGKCRRCRRSNSDRRLQAVSAQEACARADMATYAASIASTATRSAAVAFSDLKLNVLDYCDFISSAQESIINAKVWTQEGREASKIAQREARRARQQCQLAKKASTDMERIGHVRSAGTASNDALNAAQNAKSRFNLIRNQQEQRERICREEPEDSAVITIQSVCMEAELANYAADMTTTVAIQTGKYYTVLKDRAMGCSSLASQEQFITTAKGVATQARLAQIRARAEARKARTQCQLAAEATSGTELSQHMSSAQEKTDNVIEDFGLAERAYLQLAQLVSRQVQCYTSPAIGTERTVEQVCRRAKEAAYAVEMASRAVKLASTTLIGIRQDALECNSLESGQTMMERARTFVSQCREFQRRARAAAKTANAQCQVARKNEAASDANDIQQYLRNAETAVTAAMKAAETARGRFVLLRDDRTDICSKPIKNDSDSASATVEGVCFWADKAQFGADMAMAAARGATAWFRLSNNRALDACQDLKQGQDQITKAKRTLTVILLRRKLALNGAKRAKAECRLAKEDSKSSVTLQARGTNAKRYATDALTSAKRAKTNYSRLRNALSSTSICGDDPRDTARESDVFPPPPTSLAGPPPPPPPSPPSYYTGGTGDRQESLRSWLVQLANMLYVKIPPPIMEAYSSSAAVDDGSCRLEGFKVNIRIDAFERLADSAYYIEDESDCSSVIVVS